MRFQKYMFFDLSMYLFFDLSRCRFFVLSFSDFIDLSFFNNIKKKKKEKSNRWNQTEKKSLCLIVVALIVVLSCPYSNSYNSNRKEAQGLASANFLIPPALWASGGLEYVGTNTPFERGYPSPYPLPWTFFERAGDD